jgi:FHS family Na+ dependent glucose MFS transporter 1
MALPVADRASAYLSTGFYYYAFIALGILDASLGPTLPWLAERTGVELGATGLLFTVRASGYVLGSFVVGRMFDKLPGHLLIATGVLFIVATLALTPSMTTFLALAALLFVSGIGGSALDVACNTLLAWLHGERVGPFMQGLHLCFGIGALLAPAIVAQALRLGFGLDSAYWIMALLAAPLLLAVPLVPSPARRSFERAFDPELPSPSVLRALPLAILLMLYVGLEVAYGGWIFTYATRLQLLSPADAAYLTSLYWGTFTLGRLVGILLASVLSMRRLLWLTITGSLASVALVALNTHVTALWIGTALLGISVGPIFPTVISLAEQRLGLTGKITSVFLIFAGLGAMSIPWLIGALMEAYGPSVLPTASLVTAAVLAVFYLSKIRPLTTERRA